MKYELIALTVYIIILLSFLYVTYILAKKNTEFIVFNLAFCVLLVTFDSFLITMAVQFYIIWILYFNWANKEELKEKNKENGNDKIDK